IKKTLTLGLNSQCDVMVNSLSPCNEHDSHCMVMETFIPVHNDSGDLAHIFIGQVSLAGSRKSKSAFGLMECMGPASAPYAGARIPRPGEQNGCALIIPGPGKSAGVDFPLGGFSNAIGPNRKTQQLAVSQAYDGPGTCITYESINHAFHEAKSRLGLPAPSQRDLSNKDVGQIARVVLETSRIISRQYSLPADAITNGLPLIDTTKTVIDQYCPYFLKFPACEPKRYRTYTGLCNNLEKPHWGSAQSAFKRLLPPAYADAKGNRHLPSKEWGRWAAERFDIGIGNAIAASLSKWG
ncbi:unnamed protein product, partial [Notodromas monacha]